MTEKEFHSDFPVLAFGDKFDHMANLELWFLRLIFILKKNPQQFHDIYFNTVNQGRMLMPAP